MGVKFEAILATPENGGVHRFSEEHTKFIPSKKAIYFDGLVMYIYPNVGSGEVILVNVVYGVFPLKKPIYNFMLKYFSPRKECFEYRKEIKDLEMHPNGDYNLRWDKGESHLKYWMDEDSQAHLSLSIPDVCNLSLSSTRRIGGSVIGDGNWYFSADRSKFFQYLNCIPFGMINDVSVNLERMERNLKHSNGVVEEEMEKMKLEDEGGVRSTLHFTQGHAFVTRSRSNLGMGKGATRIHHLRFLQADTERERENGGERERENGEESTPECIHIIAVDIPKKFGGKRWILGSYLDRNGEIKVCTSRGSVQWTQMSDSPHQKSKYKLPTHITYEFEGENRPKTYDVDIAEDSEAEGATKVTIECQPGSQETVLSQFCILEQVPKLVRFILSKFVGNPWIFQHFDQISKVRVKSVGKDGEEREREMRGWCFHELQWFKEES